MNKTKAHQLYRTKDGSIVPGVTTALGILAKPALVPWANKLGLEGIDVRKYVDDKADIGTLAHQMVEDHLTGKETDTSEYSQTQIDQAQNSVLSWLEWEKQHPIMKVNFVEKQLVSEKFRFGGTEDIYCVMKNNGSPDLELIDLKTGGIYDEGVYQVGALKMLMEENGFSVNRCRIICIPRTEDEVFTEKVLSEKEIEVGQKIFMACLEIYNAKRELNNERRGGKR